MAATNVSPFPLKHVTKSNFDSAPSHHIRAADFMAIDLEMTCVTGAVVRLLRVRPIRRSLLDFLISQGSGTLGERAVAFRAQLDWNSLKWRDVGRQHWALVELQEDHKRLIHKAYSESLTSG